MELYEGESDGYQLEAIISKGKNLYGFVHIDGKPTRLVPYRNFAEISSTQTTYVPQIENDDNSANALGALCVGPGLFFDEWSCAKKLILEDELDSSHLEDDPSTNENEQWFVEAGPGSREWFDEIEPQDFSCHLFIRLDATPQQERLGLSLDSTNPNTQNEGGDGIAVFGDEKISIIDSQHIRFEGIRFENLTEMVFSRHQNSDDQSIDAVDIVDNEFLLAGSIELTSNHSQRSSVSRIRIQKNKISHGFPPYVFWSDVKYGYAEEAGLLDNVCQNGPAGCFQRTAIAINVGDPKELNYVPDCVSIEDNQIEDVWFGVSMGGVNQGFVIHNKIEYAHDDGILFSSKYVHDLEIAFNEVSNSFNGITQLPVGAPLNFVGI